MNKRNRSLKKSKPMKIQQNIPADPPQSFERNEEVVPVPESVVEVSVVASTRDGINFELKGLSQDIGALRPNTLEWKQLLSKIKALHRKLKTLK